MCIALLSTAHPAYPFILLSNRDEFLSRPTARVHWWEGLHPHVIGPRDLKKQEHGTWLGMTLDGRFAVLTNFRDEGVEVAKDKSRGGLVSAWLQPDPSSTPGAEHFADHLIHDVGIHDVGGFSLAYGLLRKDRDGGLAILSNRNTSSQGLTRILKDAGETHGLSNSHYGDLTWPKVVHGEMMLKQAIAANVSRGDSQEKLIQSLFAVLDVDTLPKRKEGETWLSFVRQLRNSILIPPVGGEPVNKTGGDALANGRSEEQTTTSEDALAKRRSKEQTTTGRDGLANGTSEEQRNAPMTINDEGAYGTHKQTVVLVDTAGKVHWIERTLYDEQAQPIPADAKDVHFDFQIKGWES